MLAVLLSDRRKDTTAGTTAAMVTVLTLPCETSLSLCAIDPDADWGSERGSKSNPAHDL